MIPLDDIREAAENLHGVAHHTPVYRSETFSQWAGCEVFLKHENQQRTGSFKIRGAYTKLRPLSESQRAAGVDTVVVPLGGGGLLSGVANAVKALHPQVRVIGVEAAGCAPYVSSLEKGEIEPVHQTTTIADGIAVKRPGEVTFPLVRELVDDVVTVTDAEIGQTMVHLLERSKTVVEGAGAVGLAAILAGRVTGRKVVTVLSGGNIDTPLLMQVIRFGLTNQGRYLVIRTRLIDRPGQLMNLLKVIADAHVNILVVSHHRESVEVAVAETGIELILETRDEAHAEQIVTLVRSQGYPVTRMR